MASIGHFAQSYITNLYDKQQKKKKNCQPIGGARAPPVVTPLVSSNSIGWLMRNRANKIGGKKKKKKKKKSKKYSRWSEGCSDHLITHL